MSRFLACPHQQGTPEWRADRLGRVTGSRVAAIFATVQRGEAAARADYRMELALERLTGRPADGPRTTADMQWGIDHEADARVEFEADTGLLVRESGFCYLPDLMAGCSVDGFIDADGQLGVWEAKCPKSKTHLAYLDAGVVPPAYLPQVLHNLWITGADFCQFMSYDPRFPAGLQKLVVHLARNSNAIAAHESAVLKFLAEVDDLEQQLRRRAA